MLDWLDTEPQKTPEKSALNYCATFPEKTGEAHSSRFPGFENALPVSETARKPAWLSHSPGFPVFPVSKQGGAGKKTEKSSPQGDEKPRPIPEQLPELLDAIATLLDPAEVEELRTLSTTEPDTVADTCRLILPAPPFPTAEDAAELDRLIVRLCDLEPWLAGYLPKMQAARLNMAPAIYGEELAKFRQWINEAEAKTGGRAGARSG